MNIEVFTLCRRHIRRQNSVDVLGAFTGVWSRTAPYSINGDVIAVRLNFIPEEDVEGDRKLTIVLRDQREYVVETTADTIEVEYDGYPLLTHDRGYELRNIILPAFGNYSFHLYVDGKQVSVTRLTFLQAD
jgi:hypothetical protein